MKLLGGALLWISLTCVGAICSIKLKKHIIILEKTILMLEEMKIQLSYLNVPVYDLMMNLKDKDYFKELVYLRVCFEALKNGDDFPNAWKKSIETTFNLYKTQEKESLLQLGQNLGTSSIENQLQILNIQLEYFKDFLEISKSKYKKYGNTLTALGILSGCMIFILVI